MLKDVPGMLGIVLSDREGIPIVRSVWVVNVLARRVIRGGYYTSERFRCGYYLYTPTLNTRMYIYVYMYNI